MAKKKKKTAKKKVAKKKAKKSSKKGKFHLINELHESILEICDVTRTGEVRIKRTELKACVEDIFTSAAKAAAKGERVRFPVVGALARRDVKPRKAGNGVNPFTGEAIKIKARPASKKPRWSFPKTMRETFARKSNWK